MVELFGTGVRKPCHIPRGFNDSHLHSKANPEVGYFTGASEFCRFDFTFCAALAEAARNQNRMEPFEVRSRVFTVEEFCVDPFNFDLHTVGHAAVG